MSLLKIQSELKAPKNQFNSFGKYKYRSTEDILEAVDFLSNLHKIEDKAFHPARHACLSLMNYLDTLDRRIKPFLEFKPKDEIGLKAKEFLDNKILPKIGELKKNFPKDSSFKKQLGKKHCLWFIYCCRNICCIQYGNWRRG